MTTIKVVTVLLSLAVTGLGLTAQVRKNYTKKSVEGLSFPYFFLLAISYSFWSIYGFLQKDLVLIVPMSIGMIMSWTVFGQFIRYGNGNKPV